MKPLPMVKLWPFAVRVHQTRLSARYLRQFRMAAAHAICGY